MRKSLFITLSLICAAASVNAVVPDVAAQSPQPVKRGAVECRIHAVSVGDGQSWRTVRIQGRHIPPGAAARAAEPGAPLRRMPGLTDMSRLRRMAGEARRQRLDKVVCTLSSTGAPYSLQEFRFDGHGWPVSRVNSLWDEAKHEYSPVETYGYTWNEQGYCSSQWMTSDLYGAGERRDYKYDDRNLGIEQTVYTYNPFDEEKWIPSSKGEYVYDDRGNIIEETIYMYDTMSGRWQLSQKNKAAWDGRGLQTLFESYYWDGSAWAGIDDRQEYTWAAKDKMTQCKSYTWQDGEWVYYCNLEQDFNGDLSLTRREKRFYNRDAGNWNGCCTWNGSYCTNEKSVLAYDERGRMTSSHAYGMPQATGEWVLGAWDTHVWTELDGGGCRDDYKGYLGSEDDCTDSYAGTESFDAEGRQTYVLDKMYDYAAEKLLNDYERATTYSAAGDMLTEITYSFKKDEANTRVGELAVENTYDGNGNLVGTVNMSGADTGIPLGAPRADDASGDGVDWQYTTKFEYFYENDTVRVKKLGYKWQDGEWTLNQGEAAAYDYDVPVEDIVAWPGLGAYHKIAQTRSFVMGSADDWYVFDYVYSDIASGISGVTGGKGGVRVWPTVVGESFSVEASGGARVSVYSMSGALVLTSAPGRVSVSGLPSGVYIVSVDGCRTKILKR